MIEQKEDNREWNACQVAPMLYAGGIGVIAGGALTAGKPGWAALFTLGAGLAITLAGIAMASRLRRGTYGKKQSNEKTKPTKAC